MRLTDALRRVEAGLLAPASTLPIGIFRVTIGAVSLLNARLLWADALAFFAASGMLPGGYDQGRTLDLLRWLGASDGVTRAVVLVYGGASLALMLGLRARLAALVAFTCLTSLYNHNATVTSGADALLRLALLFMAFAPAATRFSVDGLWRYVRTGAPIPTEATGTVTRVLKAQVAIVYFATFLAKSGGVRWHDGTAVGVALQLTEFARFPLPTWAYSDAFSRIMTPLTLLIEGAFPLFVWFEEVRLPLVLAAIGLHLGLEYALNILLFQPVMLSLLLVFVEPREWARLAALGRGALRRVTAGDLVVRFDPEAPLAVAAQRLLNALDVLRRLRWEPAPSDDGAPRLVAAAADRARPERAPTGGRALRRICLRLPALWPAWLLLCLPGAATAAAKLYGLATRRPVARRRSSPEDAGDQRAA
jgi:hypothetical protein